MSRSFRPAAPGVLVVPLLAACLCAGGCDARTATVAGRVTLRGQPLPSGSVSVYCADGQIARGNVGPDGRYSIPNVPPGAAAVTVQSHARIPPGLRVEQKLPPAIDGPVLPGAAGAGPDRVPPIPPRYAVPEESGLRVVVAGGPVTFDIDLTP
jgi:hypothetical protein